MSKVTMSEESLKALRLPELLSTCSSTTAPSPHAGAATVARSSSSTRRARRRQRPTARRARRRKPRRRRPPTCGRAISRGLTCSAEFSRLTFWRAPTAAGGCGCWPRSRSARWSRRSSRTSGWPPIRRAHRRRARPRGSRVCAPQPITKTTPAATGPTDPPTAGPLPSRLHDGAGDAELRPPPLPDRPFQAFDSVPRCILSHLPWG
jgi:hypothetical protein